ncbi:MAG: hypothetical protein K7J46_22065 [Bryobacter sp.]|jgi:hypothetical protein|nr:hypothetical protein [Bryobacter sp. CoA8 C33]
MLWEVLLLVLSVTALCCYSIGQELLVNWRNQRRALAMSSELSQLPGKMAWEAEKVFGPPTEIVEGTSGRRLYIWKALSLPRIPKADGLLVVTLTINPEGSIAETHWQQRG